MQKITDKYSFTIDNLSPEACSGWYARHDNVQCDLRVAIDNTVSHIQPGIPRPDVVAAGLSSKTNCGFSIDFDIPLRDSENLVISAADNEILFERKIEWNPFAHEQTTERLLEVVEPFVEMDIDRLRQKLMGNAIHDQYKKIYKEFFYRKSEEDLKEAISETLADIKTTQHLLCAAYLDYSRAADLKFPESLPAYELRERSAIKLELRGDITGSGWTGVDEDGRWLSAMADATLLMPTLAAGEYEIAIEATGETQAGNVANLTLKANENPVRLVPDKQLAPCLIKGAFELARNSDSVLALTFSTVKATVLTGETTEDRHLRIKSISIRRKN